VQQALPSKTRLRFIVVVEFITATNTQIHTNKETLIEKVYTHQPINDSMDTPLVVVWK